MKHDRLDGLGRPGHPSSPTFEIAERSVDPPGRIPLFFGVVAAAAIVIQAPVVDAGSLHETARRNPVLTPNRDALFHSPMNDSVVRWKSRPPSTRGCGAARHGVSPVSRRRRERDDADRNTRPASASPPVPTDCISPAVPLRSSFPTPTPSGGTNGPGASKTRVSSRRKTGTYVLTYTQWNGDVPRLAVATSRDLITWTKHGPAFATALGGKYRDIESKSGAILARVVGRPRRRDAGERPLLDVFQRAAPAHRDLAQPGRLDAGRGPDGRPLPVLTPRPGYFDSWLVEGGPPALLTAAGIVVLYNAATIGRTVTRRCRRVSTQRGRPCSMRATRSSCWRGVKHHSCARRRTTNGRDSTPTERRSWKVWCRSTDAGTSTMEARTRGSASRCGIPPHRPVHPTEAAPHDVVEDGPADSSGRRSHHDLRCDRHRLGRRGGMACHVLTQHGLQVLLLEAGKRYDINQINAELRSMQWPYDHPRRGDGPPGNHALSFNEYNVRQPPYAKGSSFRHVFSYVGGWGGRTTSRTSWWTKRTTPTPARNTPGCGRGCSVARPISGAAWRCGSPITTSRERPTTVSARIGPSPTPTWPLLRQGRPLPRHLRPQRNLEHLPDSLFQRPNKLTAAEVKLRKSLAGMNRVATPYRAGVTTDGVQNKYRSKCFGRGACGRRPGGCDIHAAFDSPTGLIYPAFDTGHLTIRPNSVCHEVLVDTNSGKARGVAFYDRETKKSLEAKGKVVILAASTLESARLLLLSTSRQYPNGIGNSSGHVGHNFCEHIMGPGVTGLVKEQVGAAPTLDDGKPGGFYVRASATSRTSRTASSAATGSRAAAGFRSFPTVPEHARVRRRLQEERARARRAFIGMGAFGEVLAPLRELRGPGPEVKDAWGIPSRPLPLSVRRQRERWPKTWPRRRRRSRGRGDRDRRRRQAGAHGRVVDS